MNQTQLTELFLQNVFKDGTYDKFALRRLKKEFAQVEFEGFYTNQEKAASIIHNLYSRPTCAACGGEVKLISPISGFNKNCSAACSGKNPDTLLKRKQTCKEKFGVENPFQEENIKRKIVEKRDAEAVVAAVKNTCLQRYGVDNPMKSKLISNKVSLTNKNKSTEEKYKIEKKKKDTSTLKYGVDHTLKVPSIRQKINQTNLAKYGHVVPLHSDQLKPKVKSRKLETYKEDVFYDRIKELEEHNIFPVGWSLDDYTGQDRKYRVIHKSCGTEFDITFINGTFSPCPKCKTGRSKIEVKLFETISTYFTNVTSSDRNIISLYEVDILINNSVGVEVNGTYWHKNDTRLLEKTKKFPGHLLHFWDFELESKFNICVSMIRAKCGSFDKVIYARKCNIKELDKKDASSFFNENHLQGECRASKRYGLYFDGELVQAISIGKPRFTRNADWEIIRHASKLGYKVVGGFSKLLKEIKKHHGGTLITYADLRYSKNAAYGNWFEYSHTTKPNYLWVKGKERLTRYETQLHKLKKKFNVIENVSEDEIMTSTGYYKIIDCGNDVFYLK